MEGSRVSVELRNSVDQLIAARRYADAERLLRQHLTTVPQDTEAIFALAELAFAQGRSDIAVQWLERALVQHPQRHDWRMKIGEAYLQIGKPAATIEHVRRVLDAHPASTVAQILIARAMARQGRVDDATLRLEDLHREQPESDDVVAALVEMLKAEGNSQSAIRLLGGVGEPPRSLARLLLLAQCLWEEGSVDHAVDIYERAVSAYPASVEAAIGLAQAMEDRGDRTGAERMYRQALRIDPTRGFAIGALLELQARNADPDLVTRGQQILDGQAATDVARALVGYGLGKVYAARAEYRNAFSVWTMANEARRREAGPFDRAAFSQRVTELIQAFPTEYFRERSGWGHEDDRPVFVVGMPRSGTTLVEQIIASHPDAVGFGELPEIPEIAKRMVRAIGGKWPNSMQHADAATVRQFATQYLQALHRRNPASAKRCVDKAPTNFLYLGLIATLFPRAHVVWCRRDPRDVCLSIYAENFGLNQRHATDLRDLAAYFAEHERLMRHWQSVLSVPIHELSYGELIRDPGHHTAELLRALDLEWNDACLDFHHNERSVQTPSRWQVRQPLYSSSSGKWKHYEQWLGPLFEALRETGTVVD